MVEVGGRNFRLFFPKPPYLQLARLRTVRRREPLDLTRLSWLNKDIRNPSYLMRRYPVDRNVGEDVTAGGVQDFDPEGSDRPYLREFLAVRVALLHGHAIRRARVEVCLDVRVARTVRVGIGSWDVFLQLCQGCAKCEVDGVVFRGGQDHSESGEWRVERGEERGTTPGVGT